MISSAKLRYLRIAPRKVRLVVDLIRGEKVEQAQTILHYTQKKAALPLLKLLNQALANIADKNPKENIYISKIFVDEGPSLKRVFPRARGRADMIRKKTSHITIVLDEVKKKTEKPSLKGKGKKKKKETTEVIEKKEIPGTDEAKKTRERKKWRQSEERIKPKKGRGLRRFFRRKAI